MLKIINRLWESPTINTWLSYSTRTLSLLIVLPLILKNFSSAEVALWYLFATIIAFQGLADFGFKMTFIRIISFAMAGAEDIVVFKNQLSISISNGAPNWVLVGEVFSMMKYIYRWLALVFFMFLITLGSWAMLRPISFVPHVKMAWVAWFIIICIASVKFYGTIYANYLEGLNKIALVRRWETLTSIGAILTSLAALVLFKSLISLVIANQLWILINLFRDYKLTGKVENGAFNKIQLSRSFDKVMFKKVWGPAWRSGLSGFMSNGLASLTSILYAQIGSAANVASYLLALRMMAQVKDISMAPFYSKIPLLSRLRSQGDLKSLILTAQKGMALSNIVFVICAIGVGVFGPWLLTQINSDVKFISDQLWIILVIAYFVHRYGAMHIQLYSTTNHIVSHIADGVSGIIFFTVTLLLLKRFELYAIPIGMLAGYLGFYSWYAAAHSLKSIKMSFIQFETKVWLIPVSVLVLYSILTLL